MKGKYYQKIFTKTLALLLLAITLFSFISVDALAASNKPCFYEKKYYAWYYQNSRSGYFFKNSKKGDKLVSFKSSNKNIAIVEKDSYKNQPAVRVTPKKVGTVKITARIKRGSKTYETSTNITFIKYSNPFTSVKIGNKDYIKSFKSSKIPFVKAEMSGKKEISVKTNSNWKYDSARIIYKDDTVKEYRRGNKVNLKNAKDILITLQNKKYKDCKLTVWLNNKDYYDY